MRLAVPLPLPQRGCSCALTPPVQQGARRCRSACALRAVTAVGNWRPAQRSPLAPGYLVLAAASRHRAIRHSRGSRPAARAGDGARGRAGSGRFRGESGARAAGWASGLGLWEPGGCKSSAALHRGPPAVPASRSPGPPSCPGPLLPVATGPCGTRVLPGRPYTLAVQDRCRPVQVLGGTRCLGKEPLALSVGRCAPDAGNSVQF